MQKKIISIFFLFFPFFILSCGHTKEIDKEDYKQQQSIKVPEDGTTPVVGFMPVENPTRTITLNKIGDKIRVKTGESVNFIYEGINPEGTYLLYELTDDGYDLTLTKINQPVDIEFTRMCQIFIVASPELTSIKVNPNVKYEQIVWTPREDGTWEVRIGTTNRGCKSEALDRLERLRNKEYNKRVQETKMK